jgi:anti-sigma regulatory factor (Ser/Thr protein kinase)
MPRSDGPESPAIVFTLPADVAAPAIARQHLTDYSGGMPAQLIDDALLLVSELVTNAVEHGRPEIVLTIRPSPPGIGVSVRDSGQGRPVRPNSKPSSTETRGRGLRIVDTLSSAWGVEAADPPPGKVVWFELEEAPNAE